jgi:hypothetical protein
VKLFVKNEYFHLKEHLRRFDRKMTEKQINLNQYEFNDSRKVYIDKAHVIGLFPKRFHKKILNLSLEEWNAICELKEIDSCLFFRCKTTNISNYFSKTIISLDFFNEVKNEVNIENLYLHPKSYDEGYPLLVNLKKYFVLIAPMEYYS